MAHILNGNWRSFIVTNGEPGEDDKFQITVDEATGDLTNSTHASEAITGEVKQGSVFHSVTINKASTGIRYKGILIANGPTMMLCGFLDLDPEARVAGTDDQVQEIWVATKP